MQAVQTIYEQLARTDNAAADEALRLALVRAEEPYRSRLVDTVLSRGKSPGTLELIRGYHQASSEGQARLLRGVEALYGGLYQAARSRDEQTRLNCVTIVGAAGYMRLAELVATMLRDQLREVRERAGALLLSWAEVLANKANRTGLEAELARLGANERPAGKGGGIRSEGSDLHVVLAALRRAVRDYEVHGQMEAIRAAMILTSAQAEGFWDGRLGGYHAVGRAVRAVLLDCPEPVLAHFCVTALGHSELRSTAARALSQHHRADYVVAAAGVLAGEGDHSVRSGLKYVREPRWLGSGQFKVGELTSAEQLDLVALIAGVGGPVAAQLEALADVARQTAEPAGLKAVRMLTEKGQAEPVMVLSGLEAALDSRTEAVALAAARELVRLRHPRLRGLMVKQLSSGHGEVRRYAGQYLRHIAFGSYWGNFERLSPAERVTGGRVVFKLDPQAGQRWRERARHPSPTERLRAVQVARALGPIDDWTGELTRLTGDGDRKVRSCAVAALGEIDERSAAVERCLWGALGDSDGRVRANAVEALAKGGSAETAARLRGYMSDEHNRVRANAIRAVMGHQVRAARQAVAAMLQDRRPAHRRSGRWLVAQAGWLLPGVAEAGGQRDSREGQSFWQELADEHVAVGV